MDLSQKYEQDTRRKLWYLVLASVLLQLLLAAVTESYPYDYSCFSAWSTRVAELGPAQFYAPDYFCDYPPGYILLLWLPGQLLRHIPYEMEALRRMVLALWPAMATGLCGPVVYHYASRHTSMTWALRCAAAAMFCPSLLFNSGVWGQIDGVFALLILCCFIRLEEQRWMAGAAFFGAALIVKPQALLVGPVLAICFLLPILFGPDTKARLEGLKNGVMGVVTALGPILFCGVWFWGVPDAVPRLLEKYFSTTTSYPYATINAGNLMALLGGEWKPQTDPVYWLGRPIVSWQTLGTVLLLALTVWCAVWAVRAWKKGTFSPVLAAAVYAVAVFTVSHRMHERYLIFALVLLAAAAGRYGSKPLLGLYGGFTLVTLFNMALVYCNVGGEDEFLSSAMNTLMLKSIALADVVLCIVLLQQVWKLCLDRERVGSYRHLSAESLPHKAARTAQEAPAWTRREALGLAGLTAVVALVSFVYLGELTAPQNPVDANGNQTLTYTLETQGVPAEVWVYAGISEYNNGKLTLTDAAGDVLLETTLDQSNTFKWKRYMLTDPMGPYTVTVENGQIFELSFRDGAGQPMQVTAGGDCPLVDEQALVPETISQLNSFYFDEIYHARTGYEHLHKMPVYETTHPPMGKNFIALGIALFGMTGFGWRFFGTLFGVLMVPALYDFTRRLTGKPRWAGFAAALLALDFMRFSQTRLATIDSYVVLFILLGADMLLWYCHSVLKKGVGNSLLPMALGGLAFGFGCASKWTGIYAGAGLAILYFGVLWQRCQQLLARPDGRRQVKEEVTMALVGGVLFYVIVPLGIYWLSYLPYVLRDPSFGLADWWACQDTMFWYHSQLESTHPFASEWYTWLLDARPVWYYQGENLPEGMVASLAGFVSPVLMLSGLVGWLYLAYRQLIGRGSRPAGLLIVVTLSSLLPWVLVTRCTFLYHVFPIVPMLAAAAALALSQWEDRTDAPDKVRAIAVGILAAALLAFVWFYPVLAGAPIPKWWAATLRWLPSWGFYIL